MRVNESIRSIDNRKSNCKESPYFSESRAGGDSAICDYGYRERVSLYRKRQSHQLLPCLRQQVYIDRILYARRDYVRIIFGDGTTDE